MENPQQTTATGTHSKTSETVTGEFCTWVHEFTGRESLDTHIDALRYFQSLLLFNEAGTHARQTFTLSIHGQDMLFEIADLIEVMTKIYTLKSNIKE
jgi:hypothetical protein